MFALVHHMVPVVPLAQANFVVPNEDIAMFGGGGGATMNMYARRTNLDVPRDERDSLEYVRAPRMNMLAHQADLDVPR